MTVYERIIIWSRKTNIAEFSTNAASEVIITPTTTSSEVIVLAFRISTAGASGIVQLESSSTSVGYGGVIAKV